MPRLLVLSGGPYHPVAAQMALVRTWLPPGWTMDVVDGAAALDRLGEADLFIAAGLHWEGMNGLAHDEPWRLAGWPRQPYAPPSDGQKDAFRQFVRAGRPVLAFHGGILSFDEWTEYGALLGFRWDQGYTGHSVVADWTVRVDTDRHPVVAGVPDYVVRDELYFNVQTPPDLDVRVHARAPFAEWVNFPMVLTAERSPAQGGGRTAYLANGHSMEAMQPPSIRLLWQNTLSWLLQR